MKKTFNSISFFLSLFFLFSFNYTFSQLNEWTWIRGDSAINNLGNQGTSNIPSVLNDPSARFGSCTWRDANNNFWAYGGYSMYDNDIRTSDNQLWKYNPSTNEWTFIMPTGSSGPMPRFSAVSWTDNAGNLWLFGGFGINTGSSFPGYLDDLWKFNISSNSWTFVKGNNIPDQPGTYGFTGLPSITNQPGGRVNSSAWIDYNNNLWLFGGIGYGASNTNGKLNDLWKYDINANTWTWIKGSSSVNDYASYGIKNIPSASNTPGARNSSMNWKDQSGNLWLMGGVGYINSNSSFLNDLWKYNIATNEWVWVNGYNTLDPIPVYGTMGVASPLNEPGGIAEAVSWSDTNENFWLFGGRGFLESGFGDLNSLWKYNVATDQWTFFKGDNAVYVPGIYGTKNIAAASNKPGARQGAMGWTDDAGDLWLFAGVSDPLVSIALHNDLWKFTLNTNIPVKLISFTGKLRNDITYLDWKVEQEENFDRYEIERSMNAADFKKVGEIKAMNIKNYSYKENVSTLRDCIVYYRLKMIDIDGKFSYSNVINFHRYSNESFSLYPNPANTFTLLGFNKNLNGKVYVEINNAEGKTIFKNQYKLAGNNINISTSKLAAGTYHVTIIYNEQRFIQNLVIVR